MPSSIIGAIHNSTILVSVIVLLFVVLTAGYFLLRRKRK
ncbi:MAG: LPXTG cell wall anchor domain-containing protein [Bacteroidales bacterium]|nr:LPXTG cell wall anchor domain-containing protein [Bacteroidales bacterium]MBP7038012.1 LPXTG cell wall anchor domain-containing protein [Bacteroidales bacterium]MDI9553179.1 LPXTG cell wall anchor domain-containing protein [Bacteroidota bacterium]